MLSLLFIVALIGQLHGAPTSQQFQDSGTGDPFIQDDSLNNHFGTRQASQIIISCLATIFACTWTAIHPNIPGPCDSKWDIFKRQLTTMIYAILAPETITGWALRQNLAARKITKEYNQEIGRKYSLAEQPTRSWFQRTPLSPPLGKGEALTWTVTHGFFLQMGGFMFCKDGQPVKTLDHFSHIAPGLLYHIRIGDISPLGITEAEIQDRSKGDGLTKALVVFQTTWFIVQCIVRWSSSLPVTELEIVTLGFALLNGITYGLWWNKPQSVDAPVYLQMKDTGEVTLTQRDVNISEERAIADEGQNPWTYNLTALPVDELSSARRSFLRKKLQEAGTGWQKIWKIPYLLVQTALRPLSKIMHFSATYIGDGELRVPMFYSASAVESYGTVDIVTSAIASFFGLIHLLPAWALHFPSHPEMFLWRISAVTITAQPILLAIWSWRKDGYIDASDTRSSPLAFLAIFGLPLYIIARLSLVILAVISQQHTTAHPHLHSPITGSDPSDLFPRDGPINSQLEPRQVNDIVLSCLATIFACTWTAIHPNFPDLRVSS